MEGPALSSVLALATSQHGVISLDQAHACGLRRSQLRTAVANGVLVAEAPRVYAVGGAPTTVSRRQMAGLLCLGPEAALSHEAAARLHSFDRSLPEIVELTVPRCRRGVRTPFVVHTTKFLSRLDVVTVDGWRCTSATRTVIDLARLRIPTIRLEAAIDSAVRSGASAPLVLARRLEELRGRGRWGAPVLDTLLLDAGGHTVLERRFLRLVRRAGLPRPTTQFVHRQDGRTVARVDFCFEAHGVVVEVSGQRGHSSPGERARDAHRRNELQDLGRRVFEYTFEDVTRRPHWVISDLEPSAATGVRQSCGRVP
jgi:very-short-patch-repair endonuclease